MTTAVIISVLGFALLMMALLVFAVVYLQRASAEERDKLYRLIKAESLTDYTKSVPRDPPKGRNFLREGIEANAKRIFEVNE
jgi:hypothetical protein